jgi:Bacterial regulatory proteins, luxR family
MLGFRRMMAHHWKRVIGYGGLLAAGTLGLEWLDYTRLARTHSRDLALLLVACGFMALGLFVGIRAFRPRSPPAAFDGNPAAIASLGITPRELTVLQRLAIGQSNKEIARDLDVAPDTVKTHVSRCWGKSWCLPPPPRPSTARAS